MILKEQISSESLKKLENMGWYRHGIYRSIFLWAVELIPSLSEKYFQLEGINKGLDNVIQLKGEFYVVQSEFDDFCEIYSDRLKDGITYLNKYIKDYYNDINLAIESTKRIGQIDVSKLSNSDLAKLFSDFFDQVRPFHHWLWSMEFLNESFDRKIRAEFARVYPNWSTLEIDDFLGKVSYTHKRQYFQKEIDEVVTLHSLEDPRINDIFEKYRWSKMCFIEGYPYSFEEYGERVSDFLENKEKLLLDIKLSKENADRAKQIIDSVGDEQLKKYLFLMQELLFLKTYRIDIYTLAFYHILNLREEITKRLNLNHEQLLHCSIQEIVSALSGVALSVSEINSRGNWCFVKTKDDYEFYKGKLAVDSIRKSITANFSGTQSLSGTVAFKGLVKGKVRVSYSSKDIDSFEAGEILVCNLTNPDYNPIFKKVAGIITDEGGVLCHSAIMAREFKIPCVIGTKIATQVLKTGDLVELDAEKGIVRLL